MTAVGGLLKMTHLTPDDDRTFLSVDEVVRRAKREFCFTHRDAKQGLCYVSQKLLDSRQGLSHDEKDQALARVADSVQMIVGDDRRSDKDFLKCYVIPGEPVAVEYAYAGHEKRVEPLLVRLAKALGYKICRT